ncbi:hypothetical protein [Flavobacterium aquidurense]|uniref:hypothetical protein n=1 Tax=Flavobacterium aquidurense TaxID=362413 RepID=UPI00285B62C4|nr:hypothetical protein [Flavobacterium aquidurense]MDR7369268.1 hypothetical protein [Flavobacterium aquidurense]
MKKTTLILLFSVSYFIYSCGSDDKKQAAEKIEPVSSLKPVAAKTFDTMSLETSVITSENLIPTTSTNKKTVFVVKKTVAPVTVVPSQVTQQKPITTPAVVAVKKENNEDLMTFVNLRKILTGTKIGQTMSQKDLTNNFKIPEEAVKLVKSVTRTAHDELAVKWRSTWLVEKVSDAELEDGKMKIRFQANKMFMSGGAIGIKYNRKVYSDLIIIGHSAYIPSVKGYHWQIGK